ncbi:MAG: hypothetical protein AABZ55_12720 [Bdellovibrionota bacterium]
MFKNIALISMTLFSITTASFAADKTFICNNVGGTEEWTIYIDLGKKAAGFFDNDTTVWIPLKDIVSLESMPPQTLYTFEGKDTGTSGKERISISFNKTRLSGSVTFHVGRSNEKTLEAKDGCQASSL